MEEKGKQFSNQVFTREVKAGKKRRYYIDVKKNKHEDYYIAITESKRTDDPNRFVRHKIFIYKEDFNKIQQALEEAVDYIKTELLPDFDFEKFDRDEPSASEVNSDGNQNNDPADSSGSLR